MTQTIEQHLVTEFTANVILQAQQMTSRFRGKVKEVSVQGNDYAIDRINEAGSVEVTARHAATVAQDITHSRRQLKMREFRSTLLLDKFDELQMLADPSREYAQATARELMRVFDRVAAGAAFASVQTGRNFGTSVTFANDGGQTITAGGLGLTYDKLLEAQQNFIDENVGVDMPTEYYMAITGAQNTNVMKESELTSGDFNRENGFIRDAGRMMKGAGFNFIHFSGTEANPILSKTSTTRDCIAWTPDAICVGINKDIEVTPAVRADLNNTLQIQASMFLGATRAEGAKVQKVQCTE